MANLNSTADIMSYVELANAAPAGTVNPELFYNKQLLDTIRIDGSQFVYYRYADESPIQDKADKLVLKRWSPLQAHVVPLVEGTPPKSDKGSVEKYEMTAFQYGRYMEFTDKVNFKAVDPIVAIYTKEYSLVVMETFDILARNELMSKAQKFYAGGVTLITDMRIATCKPKLSDLRMITLSLKKQLVKPRSNGKYHVLVSPDFVFDMLDDDYIVKYMQYNQTTKTMYDNASLIPLFDMEFYETLVCPAHGRYVNALGKKCVIAYKTYNAATDAAYVATKDAMNYVYRVFDETGGEYSKVSGWVTDKRTGDPASYIPDQDVWTLPAGWTELKIHHILMLGADALTRTGLAGEQNAKMFVKPLGSAGVLDPIDQRQSIGFKINSVGFGSVRLEAIVDYLCIPTQANL